MRILVTGREGQLVRALRERAGPATVELITAGRPELDLGDPDSAAAVVERLAPDLVINTAAYTAVDRAEDEPDVAFRINAEAPGAMATAANRIGARFFQVSTDYVFDGEAEWYAEDAPTNPQSVYGASKLAGERAVMDACADALVVRTAWVYSPYRHNFVRTMIRLAETRDELTVVGDQMGCPTSAIDVADGLLALAAATYDGRAEPGIYHCAGTGSTSWAGLAAAVMEQCRLHGAPHATVRPISTAEWPTPAPRPASSRLRCTRFEDATGTRMPAWQDSVATTVARLIGNA